MSFYSIRASAAQRVALCPGSLRACEQIPPPHPTEEAERGTRVHEACAAILKGLQVEPNDDTALAQLLVGRFVERVAKGGYRVIAVEHAMAIGTWHGRCDAVLEIDNALHVVDWKTGWGYVPDAADNAQLRVYVAMASTIWPRDMYYAHIVTPREITSVAYMPHDIEAAKAELDAIAKRASAENAPRIPTPDACRYCPAYATDACPESAGVLDRLPTLRSASDKLKLLNGDALGALLDQAKIVEKLIDMLEEEAKSRLLSGEPVRGYQLKAGATRMTVRDTKQAMEILRDAGIPKDKLWDAASLSVSSLVDAIAEVKAVPKNAARAELKGLLGELVEEKQFEPIVVRAK